MSKNHDLDYMLQYAKFDHIKEMLFYRTGFSCNDKPMINIINSHGGLNKYFEELKAKYIVFLQKDKNE